MSFPLIKSLFVRYTPRFDLLSSQNSVKISCFLKLLPEKPIFSIHQELLFS